MTDTADTALTHAMNDHFRLLIGGVREYAIYMLDPMGRILTWNPGAEHLKGYTEAEVLGTNFRRFFSAEDLVRKVPEQILANARSAGEHRGQGWRVRKDGSTFWADVLVTALNDPEGGFRGFAKVTRDQTEKHAMEEQLRSSEERFRLLVGGLKEHALYLLDPAGMLQSWNEGAERIKQYSQEEVIGRNFQIFFTPDDRASNKPQRELDLATTLGVFEEEGWRLRKDGTRFWASVVVTALRDATGELKGFAKVTRDETKRHQANIDLHLALDRAIEAESMLRKHAMDLESRVAERTLLLTEQTATLRRLNAELEQFTYMASHDLQEPLRMITMHLEMLRMRNEGNLDDRSLASIETACAGSSRMRSLIDSLLSYTRIDHAPKSSEPTDANRAVQEALENLQSTITARHAVVRANPLPHLPIEHVQLVQVFQNLIANGIKYNRSPAPSVKVSALRQGTDWLVRIQDNGIGIPEQYQSQLFQPFRRLHDQSEFPGTGVGLAIVKKIIERHGGRIELQSSDSGTCFSFALRTV